MLKYVFLIIIIILLIIYCIYNIKSNNINYIHSNNIYNIFNKESIQNYLNLINDNMYDIRMNSNKYLTYEENVIDFNNMEKKYLNYNIYEINQKLLNYKQLYNTKWNLIKTRNNLEYGRPFTLDEYIFLPENDIFNLDIKTTLLHEKLHIHQRLNQDKYNTLYEQYLDWYLEDNIILSNYIKENIVVNPDGTNNNWYFYYKNLKIVPLLIYENNYKIKYYILNNNKIDKEYTNNKDITNFLKNKYNIKDNYYHPNEIIVTILTDYLLYNKKIDKNLLHFII